MSARANKESQMAKMKSIAALLAAGSVLAACGPITRPQIEAHNPSIYSRNQPIVERTDYVLDLDAGGVGVPDAELVRLAGWFESLRVDYGDRIYVEEAYANGPARRDVAKVASEFGLLLAEGAPVTAGEVSPGAVRVVVSRSRASVPGCPNWAYANLPGEPITTDPNFGCAVNSNLAAMIANPEDLVRGQQGSGADPRAGAKAIATYRSRVLNEFSNLKREKTSGDSK